MLGPQKGAEASVTPTILLIEDNEADVELFREAASELKFSGHIKWAKDSKSALEALSACPHPDLVFLDLNLPSQLGLDFLVEVRADPALTFIPIIVFTTHCAADELRRAHALGANACLFKPSSYDELLAMVQVTLDFWLGSVIYPARAW